MDGVEPKSLWAGIEAALPETTNQVRPTGRGYWWGLAFLLLVLLGGGVRWQGEASAKGQLVSAEATSHHPHTQKTHSSLAGSTVTPPPTDAAPVVSPPVSSPSRDEVATSPSANAIVSDVVAAISIPQRQLSTPLPALPRPMVQGGGAAPVLPMADSRAEDQRTELEPANLKVSTVGSLKSLVPAVIVLPTPEVPYEWLPAFPETIYPIPRYWQIGVGMNSWSQRLANQALEAQHQSEPGLSASAQVQLTRSYNFHFVTGLHYNLLRSEFNYAASYDTVMHRDNLPGNELIAARADRRVRHHNELHTFTLPLLVGVRRGSHAFQVGINGGLGVNWTLQQSGRSLDADGQLFRYGQGSDRAVYPNAFLSYHVQPYVEFKVKKGWPRVFLRGDWSYQSMGKNHPYEGRLGAWRQQWQVGVVRAW